VAATATNHWKLGLFVVLAIGVMIGGLFWLGARRFQHESFAAVAFFDESVQGLDVGSPIKFRGVTLGTVSDITVAPDHRHVQVTCDIHVDAVKRLGIAVGDPGRVGKGPFLPPELRVQLVSAGITGVRFLQVDFFDPVRYQITRLPFDPPPNYIPAAPSTLKSLEDLVLEIMNRLPTLGEQVTATLDEATGALAAVRRLAASVQRKDGPFATLLVRLDGTAQRLERAIEEAQLGPTTQALREASSGVTGVTGGLGGLGDELAASLVALQETLESVRMLADSLDRDPSALIRGPRADGAVPVKR
jgi:ABC-type transporter Mla subunit MlaD